MDERDQKDRYWKVRTLALRGRDVMRFATCSILDAWDEFRLEFSDKKDVIPQGLVEDIISTCLCYGLFEEARRAAGFRSMPGLKVAEVDRALTILLDRYLPYHSFLRDEAREGRTSSGYYNRETIRSYPPFAEILQAASDNFRNNVAALWL